MKFIMLINVKMSTIVDILISISMINTTSENLKARSFYFSAFMFSCLVELSMKKSFITLGPGPTSVSICDDNVAARLA